METGTTIHTILQCFVDVNLETDENAVNSLDLLDVSFEYDSYTVDEGQRLDVIVSLSSPSTFGYEEIVVDINEKTAKLSDFSTLGEVYPKTIAFSAGQQSHTFEFLINSDFLEEGLEYFDLIIGLFINVNPGQFITSRINIGDLTDLKEVFINNQGGFLFSNPFNLQSSTQYLTFSSFEGTEKEITISLDSPSVFGVEGVTVELTNGTAGPNDYSVIGTTNLTWAIGEKDKTFKIKAKDDSLIEPDEGIGIKLINPINVNIINPSEASFIILDNSPKPLYAQINFQGIYTQIGGTSLQNVTQLRAIANNETTGYNSDADIMLLKFGDKFISENPSQNQLPGSNAIRTTTTTGFFPSTTTTYDTIFFGKHPVTGAYGDVKLKITNKGSYPVKINGTQLNPGNGSTTLVVDKSDFKVILPANSALLPLGTIYQGAPLSDNTLTEAVYEFEIQTDYAEREFVLKNLNNTVSTNKSVNLGTHTLKETYPLSIATGVTKQHNLVMQYNQILANWDNYPYYNSPKTCIPLAQYTTLYRSFPSNSTQAISALINGFVILSDNSKHYSNGAGNGPTGYGETQYFSAKFLPNGQTIGVTCNPINYPGTTNNIAWSSLPFKIVP